MRWTKNVAARSPQPEAPGIGITPNVSRPPAIANRPAGTLRIIEYELLTNTGFRENVVEERLERSLVNPGVAPDTLATLINRRLRSGQRDRAR